jgi:hypothetical protein
MTKARRLSITQLMESRVPDSGVGSLIVFYGNDEGLLNRAGRTIRAGAELERAAAMYAREPVPSMVLKSNGTALPADRIAKAIGCMGRSASKSWHSISKR